MTPTKPTAHDDGDSYLFRVEVLVNGQSSGNALEHLLRVLNGGGFADYRIGSGIGRGPTIEEAAERERKKRTASAVPEASVLTAKASASKRSAEASDSSDLEQRIRRYIESNKLVRLNANKGQGVKVNIPCRILNYDAGKQLITVYHVDEKQVHSFKLFEIEEIME
jgi:hypothetical protein